MTRTLRALLPAMLLVGLLALSGCTGASADTSFHFNADGGFQQDISISGLELGPTDVDALQAAGWVVHPQSGFQATRYFESAEKYSEPGTALYSALMRAFAEQAGWDPALSGGVTVNRTVADYFLFERHDVAITVPSLDLAPDECPTCDGAGVLDCPDCSDGLVTCDSCDGAGGYEGWLGWDECWDCDGSGEVECSTCDGTTEVSCEDCDGSGDTPEWIQAAYTESLDGSKLAVAIEMPGIRAERADGGEPSWDMRGDEIEGADVFAASSYVVNWAYVSAIGGVLILLLVFVALLTVRRFKRRRARKAAAAGPVAVAPATPMTPAPAASVAPLAPSVPADTPATPAFCTGCGAPLGPDSRFCTRCGSATVRSV